MKLSTLSLALTAAILWGVSVLLCGIANMNWPDYAVSFLDVLDSIYPGYHRDGTMRNVIVGALYAVVDGGIGGLLFGCIYNLCAGCCGSRKRAEA